MPEVRRRKAKSEGTKDNWSYEKRAENYYGHQAMNLKTFEATGGKTRPRANYTHEGMASYVKSRKKKT